MRPRPLGNTGIAVSPLGLGTVKLGRVRGLKHPRPFRVPDDRQARQLLDTAADLGITLLDTAPAYGRSEERLGALLAGTRRRWVIATKAGEEWDDEKGVGRHDFRPEHIRFSVERSLRRLRTDVLDIVLLHAGDDDVELVRRWGALDMLLQLRAEGKLRACGVSSKTVEGGLLALERGDCAMVSFNPTDASQQPVLDRAAACGKGVLVKKPLASGHLPAADAPGAVAASFAAVLAQPGVAAAVVGTIDPDHLCADAEACARALAAAGRS